ncbi:MAG: hypothetical protein WCL54_08505 [Clostridia bacterium]
MSETMIKCKACSGEMSNDAKTCPKCGKPNKKMGCIAKGGLVFLGLIVLSTVIGVFNTADESSSSTPVNTASTGASEAKSDVTDLASLPVLSRTFFGIQLGGDVSNLVLEAQSKGINVNMGETSEPRGMEGHIPLQFYKLDKSPSGEDFVQYIDVFAYRNRIYAIKVQRKWVIYTDGKESEAFFQLLREKYSTATWIDDKGNRHKIGQDQPIQNGTFADGIPYELDVDGHTVALSAGKDGYGIHINYKYNDIGNVAIIEQKELKKQKKMLEAQEAAKAAKESTF